VPNWVTLKELRRLLGWSERKHRKEIRKLIEEFSVLVRRDENGRLLVDLDAVPIETVGKVTREDFLYRRKPFVLLSEYARKVGVSPMTVRRWLRNGLIDGVKVFRRWFVVDELPELPSELAVLLSELPLPPTALVRLPTPLRHPRYKTTISLLYPLLYHEKTRTYFILIDPQRGERLKERFPDPTELIFPPPTDGTKVSWNDLKLISPSLQRGSEKL